MSEDLSQGLKRLNSAIDGCCTPIQSLKVDYCYRYNGSDGLFSKTFIFRVLEDRFDEYVIIINETFETILEKDFSFVNAVDTGVIEYLGHPEKLNLKIKE